MKKLGLGIIGCGKVRRAHMPGIYEEAPDIEVTAACDTSPEALRAFCARYGIGGSFESAQRLFEQGDVEAVSIAVAPEEAKVGLAVEALERGLHVFVEKPMALTVREAERMATAARKAGRVLQVGFNQRFEPVHREAAEMVRDKQRFGDLVSLSLRYSAECDVPYVLFMAQLPHTFDLVQYLGGRVASIRSVVRRTVDAEAFRKALDALTRPGESQYNIREPGLVGAAVASVLRFESGAVGSMNVVTYGGGERFGGKRLELVGTMNTTVHISSMDRMLVCGSDGTERLRTTTRGYRKASSFGLEYRHFADVIRGAEPSVVTLEDGVRSVYLYEGFLRSLQTDAPVDLVDWSH